ncbi:hypothetical protein LZK73_32840 (plasmid) [Neorhizobium galegae]|nr:hypothetical protein LZK73_32840 [Neorhizobium galegae]
MMFRLSLSRRLVAIGGAGFLALWIVLISFYYLANGLSRTASNPPPGQIAAIVTLLKSEPSARWPALLDAVSLTNPRSEHYRE